MTESDIRYAVAQNGVLETFMTRFVKSCLSPNKKPIELMGFRESQSFSVSGLSQLSMSGGQGSNAAPTRWNESSYHWTTSA